MDCYHVTEETQSTYFLSVGLQRAESYIVSHYLPPTTFVLRNIFFLCAASKFASVNLLSNHFRIFIVKMGYPVQKLFGIYLRALGEGGNHT
jgi:hypothetical protein